MKKFRLSLGAMALALGAFGAFAFSPAADTLQQQAEFYVNQDGSQGDPVTSNNDCQEESNILCSQEYEFNSSTSTWSPTGDTSKMHNGPRL